MAKQSRTFHAIEETRQKAVKIRIEQSDRNAVWFPLHRVELDEESRTLSATPKLWTEKDAVRNTDFAAERRAELAEKKARAQEPVLLGKVSWSESGKAGYISVDMVEEITDLEKTARAFFPKSMMTPAGKTYTVPRWLFEAKAREAVYQWVSARGTKGVDHLGGAVLSAFMAGEQIEVSYGDLLQAQARAA